MGVSSVFQMGPVPSWVLTMEGGRRDGRGCTAGFKDGGRGHEPRNMWPLEARKGMEVDSTLELLEGNSPARTSVLMQ